ncbi:MAG TPA: biopolymer transporter ExbD [Kofleriaceae bacterium]|nr:biopolymer transporter ExbD [Kofleriaceae bacterium]
MNTGGSDQLNAEINVTPLVDVMLVLLIIFMITAPMMNTGVDLDLPQITAQQIEDPQGKLVLSIDKTRRLRLGTSVVVWKDLQVKLSKNERVQQEKQLYIEADASLPYSVVVTAMAIAKDAGVAKVMMLTDPTQNLKLDELDAAVPPGGP